MLQASAWAGVLRSYHVAVLLAERDSRSVVQTCFQGTNPQLDDVRPARLLARSQLDEAAQAVRAFAASA